LCGNRNEIQELGYRVEEDGAIVDATGRPVSAFGARRALLSELSPAASFISYNYTVRGDDHAYAELARAALSRAENQWGWLFRTLTASHGDVADRAERDGGYNSGRDGLQELLTVRTALAWRATYCRRML
jgi:hypothetical protein